MEPQSAPSVQPSEPVTRSHRTLIIAIAAGVLILAGAALAYTKLANKPAVTPSPIASATPDMGAGWKTFNSQYFTLSFSIPSGFDVADTQNEIAIAPGKYEADEMGGSNAFFVLSRYQDGQTKSTTIAAVKKELTNPTTSQVTIDGSTFTKIEGRDDAVVEGVAPGKVVYLIFDQSVARFYEHGLWTGNADTITIGNQILSTFRFTSTIKAGWKTYTNTQYGFSLQYPSDWQVATSTESDGFLVSFKRPGNYGDAPVGGEVFIRTQKPSETLETIKPVNPYVTWESDAHTIAGQPAIVGVSGEFGVSLGVVIYQGNVYTLTKELVANKEILSTFKFTK